MEPVYTCAASSISVDHECLRRREVGQVAAKMRESCARTVDSGDTDQLSFAMGLAIALQSRRNSRLDLSRSLRWLTLFGIVHGMYEWGDLFISLYLDVLRLPRTKRGFTLLPGRWVVERSFAWMAHFCRLSRDYERLPQTLAGPHFAAFAIIMLKRVAEILTA